MTNLDRSRRSLPVILGIAVLSLALSACGSGTSSGDRSTAPATQSAAAAQTAKGVYDFTPNAPRQADKELKMVPPKSLLDQIPDEVPYVTELVVKSRSMNSLAFCGVDIAFTFNPAITKDQIAEAYTNTTGNTGNWAGIHTEPMSQFDDSKAGDYISDDFKNYTVVRKCATSPADNDSSPRVSFNIPGFDKKSGSAGSFAGVELMSTKAGTIFVRKGQIVGYKVDYQGNWVKG